MLMFAASVAASGCTAYKPSPGEDTNGDGRVTFYRDDPGEWRSESARHMDRQSPDRRIAMEASKD
jgi:hypothetical protein